ncbi:MAG: xanthine dehydrogenase family protein molybdopterin-binding subunit [Rhodospirillaceae bacterium]|nr:xanthine dehydrogenase family protein molybdopterin-binding subunit [Rhodospirillaceae bacterium]MBT6428362.1 xanthine dehydrogenase family protein molybdopterin-binding subunit [Rhodospirillaceae bacterium]
MKFGLGQSAPRVEDQRFLRGGGRYTDDINLAGQAYAFMLRSPHAHARIRSIDVTAARAAPGVLAVYTGEDVPAAGLGDMPCLAAKVAPLERPDGTPLFLPPRPALVRDKVAFVGDYVAFIVAESRVQARDAGELIEVDYEPLAVNALTANAISAPAVWQDCPDNICFRMEMGDSAAVEAAFEVADHVTRLELPMPRVAINPMEPRAALGAYDPFEDRYTLYSGNQFPHDIRSWLSEAVLDVPESHLRIVSPDMGGSFGLRANIFPEMPLVLWAAKNLQRPVKWTNERSDAFLDEQARDMAMAVELALDASGRFLALRVRSLANMGAYLSNFGPLPAFGNMGGIAGVYLTPAIHAEITGVFTNTGPTGPYRGAGRPEATSAIEQAIDLAARQMGLDRVELRRRNIIPPSAMPFQTPLSYNYDCGEFERNMDQALEMADAAGFGARQDEANTKGKLRGLGIANAVEQAAGMFDEGGEIRFDRQGNATILMGTHSHGQGHETVFRQLLSDKLGLEFEAMRYVQGDTDLVAYGHGTGGSRVSGLGGAALLGASEKIIEKGRAIAAHSLEAPEVDIEFAEGRFTVAGTDRSLSLQEVAAMAFEPAMLPPGMESGLTGFATFKAPAPTFPNACHVAEVEIDRDTGVVRIARYIAVDDVGTVMNPLLLKGQLHGGIVQGAGQILGEQVLWDDSGQVLTGSFMDYPMPRADDMPSFEIETNSVPSPRNPLGIKGAGEAGTVGAVACLTSAILDALAPLGIHEVGMPATPETIWRAMNKI